MSSQGTMRLWEGMDERDLACILDLFSEISHDMTPSQGTVEP